VELVRVSAAMDVADPFAAAAALIAISGRAAVVRAAKSSVLSGNALLVLGPGEAVRLESAGAAPFYALLVGRSTAAASAETVEARGADRAVVVPVPASAPDAARGDSRIDWVRIPAGTFLMGSSAESESPKHQVRLRAFEMSRTAVTFAQYRACVAAGACRPIPEACATAAFTGDDQPVVCVDWDEARAFAAWSGGRLPSEAEWEYAARGGGRDRVYAWGDETADCARAVIREKGAGGCGREATWPVCSRPKGATVQGLCDMGGNVWEWVQDWYHDTYAGSPADGSAWETPASWGRVERSGSWIFPAPYARAASRTADKPETRGNYLGFRVVR
jgi:formylglycine-generating enzyme required for sulfatase activity